MTLAVSVPTNWSARYQNKLFKLRELYPKDSYVNNISIPLNGYSAAFGYRLGSYVSSFELFNDIDFLRLSVSSKDFFSLISESNIKEVFNVLSPVRGGSLFSVLSEHYSEMWQKLSDRKIIDEKNPADWLDEYNYWQQEGQGELYKIFYQLLKSAKKFPHTPIETLELLL